MQGGGVGVGGARTLQRQMTKLKTNVGVSHISSSDVKDVANCA